MAKRKNKRRIPNAVLTQEQLNKEVGLPPHISWIKSKWVRAEPPPEGEYPFRRLPHHDEMLRQYYLMMYKDSEGPAFSTLPYEDIYPYFSAMAERDSIWNIPHYPIHFVARDRPSDGSLSRYLIGLVPTLRFYGYDPDPAYAITYSPNRDDMTAAGLAPGPTEAYDSHLLMTLGKTSRMVDRYRSMLENAGAENDWYVGMGDDGGFEEAMIPTYEAINDDLFTRFQALEEENRRRELQRMAGLLRHRVSSLHAAQRARQDWNDALFRNNNPKRKKRRGKKKK